MRIPLGIPAAAAPGERLERRRLACEPPLLPGLTPDTVRRWKGTATWMPPETKVLARHRAIDGAHWVVTNRRDPPDGYLLEFDLGTVQLHEQPGTRQLVTRDGTYELTDAAVGIDESDTSLGHIEQAAFPMMAPLELRRFPATGQSIPVAGPDDPLYGATEHVNLLGFVEGFPIQPRRLVSPPLAPWKLVRLVRSTDPRRWRHVYTTAGWEADDLDPATTLCLGSLFTFPGPGLVALRREPGGRIVSDVGAASGASGGGAQAAARWVAAPLAWETPRRAWAVRAAFSRARRLAAAPRRSGRGHAAEALGYLRDAPAAGHSALYNAIHPVLGDQYLTRSRLEAEDMGYQVSSIVGYVGDFGAHRVRGPREILWASRFGARRRYVEG